MHDKNYALDHHRVGTHKTTVVTAQPAPEPCPPPPPHPLPRIVLVTDCTTISNSTLLLYEMITLNTTIKRLLQVLGTVSITDNKDNHRKSVAT